MKTPYRAKKEAGMWWLYDKDGHIVTFSTNLKMLWKNATYLLEPVKLASFRNVE